MAQGATSRRYRVLDVLGRGGFGIVYRAELQGPEGFTKLVALKVLNDDVEASVHHLARLRDEARVLGLVRHRAIVSVDGLIKLEGRWTVVMEYVPGITLGDLIQRTGPVPPAVALQIVEEVASALDAAHTATDRDGQPLRLLHRDVKPSNVQLTPRGEVKLLDFGIARAEYDAREAATGSVIFGSLPYMAPERLELQDSRAVDVYALGLTLVELLAGRVPKQAPGGTEDHKRRLVDVANLLEEAGAPDGVWPLVERATAFDPAERPDARSFERTCRGLRAQLPDAALRDWAESTVAQAMGEQDEAGEFTGMVLTEAETAERHSHLAELLGTAIPTTFDDPVGSEERAPTRPKPTPRASREPRSLVPPPMPAAEITMGTPLDPMPPPPKTGARRWLWLMVGLFGAAGTAVAVVIGVTSVFAGGTAMLGALVVAAVTSSSPESCRNTVDDGRTVVRDRRVKPRKVAQGLLNDIEVACAAEKISMFETITLVADLKRGGEDGVLSDWEIERIRDALR